MSDLLGEIERRIEEQRAKDRAKPRDIHAGDCTCDACYLDIETIERIENERRQWED